MGRAKIELYNARADFKLIADFHEDCGDLKSHADFHEAYGPLKVHVDFCGDQFNKDDPVHRAVVMFVAKLSMLGELTLRRAR